MADDKLSLDEAKKLSVDELRNHVAANSVVVDEGAKKPELITALQAAGVVQTKQEADAVAEQEKALAKAEKPEKHTKGSRFFIQPGKAGRLVLEGAPAKHDGTPSTDGTLVRFAYFDHYLVKDEGDTIHAGAIATDDKEVLAALEPDGVLLPGVNEVDAKEYDAFVKRATRVGR